MTVSEIGIDLGTASVVIASPEQGVLLREPSLVAVDRRIDKIIAMGRQAQAMVGRTPAYISTIYPLKNGVIHEHDLAREMIHFYISEALGSKRGKPKVTVCLPAAITGVERDAVASAVMAAGAKTVCLLDQGLAAALGSELDVTRPEGVMLVDVGGGTTDISVLSMGGKVCAAGIPVGGSTLDDAMASYMQEKHSLAVGQATAEAMKQQIACCCKNGFSENMAVKGRSLTTGLPQRIVMNTMELYDAVHVPATQIAAAIRRVLEHTPPELAGDINRDGIYLTGGASQLHGLDEFLSEAIDLPVQRVADPLDCVALGAAKSFALADRLNNGFADATERAVRLA